MHISDPSSDYLGPTYQARTMILDTSEAGTADLDIAVLVHERDAKDLVAQSGTAVLYLPGYYDTFYQTEQSDAWRSLNIPLVALEMRHDGRAVTLESTRGDIRNLATRNEEIGIAIDYLRNDLGAQRVILIGHSLGSLNAQLWAHANSSSVDLMIHVSPWLEHRATYIEKSVMTRANDTVGKVVPRTILAFFPPYYPRSLHVEYGGEFYFSPKHKPLKTSPIYAGTFRTVRMTQRQLQHGDFQVDIPTLVAHSDSSGMNLVPVADDLANTDCILSVDDIRTWAPQLSTNLEMLEVPGARHDPAVSKKPVREFYTQHVIEWAKKNLEM